MRTLGFIATFGYNPGYRHVNSVDLTLQDFGTRWQNHMQEIFEDTSILVGCVIHKSKTVYPVGFGCPIGGEDTVTVTGHFNPKFISETQKESNYWLLKDATVTLCKILKKELGQSTVSVTFHIIDDFVYLAN